MTGKIDRTSSIVDEKILLREVYVPEAVNAPTAATQGANGETLPENNTENYLKRPYIVVGLTGADKSRPDKETFFRIDYLKRTGAEADATYEYLPLLRNHRYLVNITEVGGPGFDTEEDARKGPAPISCTMSWYGVSRQCPTCSMTGNICWGSAMTISLFIGREVA